jgi:hypothetical protein
MVLCPDDITPCPTVFLSTQRRLHQGAIFISSKHLLAPPLKKKIARSFPGKETHIKNVENHLNEPDEIF